MISRLAKYGLGLATAGLLWWIGMGDIGQVPEPRSRTYSSGRITFVYPDDWKVTGNGQEEGFHMVVLDGGRMGQILIDSWASSDNPQDLARAAHYERLSKIPPVVPDSTFFERLKKKFTTLVDGEERPIPRVHSEKEFPGSENWFILISSKEDLMENRKVLDGVMASYRIDAVNPEE